MAGYIGSKAVNLSTTGADIAGDADVSGDLTVDTSTLHVDSTNNRVGIGTTSPSTGLSVVTGSANGIELGQDSDASTDSARLFFSTSAGSNAIHSSSGAMRFFTGSTAGSSTGTQVMTLNASGNLLVGTTDTSPHNNTSGEGVMLAPDHIEAARDSASVALFNRMGTDGEVVLIKKNGSTVGSIGCGSTSRLIINGDSNGIAFERSGTEEIRIGNNVLQPSDDNDCDLGLSFRRFDDIYATNGTIQTSDRNEKQDIAELSDAEQRVAVAAKGLLRKFRWKDAVAENGDEARTHFGIIAQDLQAAFAAEGLDAGDYAMFCSDTWWETQTEVPAVEAVAEVTEITTDEDGNEVVTVVTEAVEAKDAYTRTDTYETAEEAPEGATERTRLGVRYSELLAFIIGAL